MSTASTPSISGDISGQSVAVSRPTSLGGVLSVPGDKSISHRSMILNAIAQGDALVQGLSQLGVEFKGVDVLSDPGLRQGIKDFTDWPTIPQLYVKGDFVGGADIVREMIENGELETMFKDKEIGMAQA